MKLGATPGDAAGTGSSTIVDNLAASPRRRSPDLRSQDDGLSSLGGQAHGGGAYTRDHLPTSSVACEIDGPLLCFKILAKERKTLCRQHAKKDYTIARLRAKIAFLEETVKAQETQLKDLEGEGEDIQGDGTSYLSDDDDFEEDEDLVFHPYVDGYEFMEAGVDDFIPIDVDEE
ncbi:hypothetical protein QYE76_048800 [Lolium multiflorum]|uniref:Uncharacterized protein n=1 Tax=Lolium multiflorum TaxID=4521 RepID=A0AAD8WG88_LOLMU|nr:hypothetical protein QYE76_048800 [Lolium multiflorum]